MLIIQCKVYKFCLNVYWIIAEKKEADIDRERSLIDQWVCLTEERNAVLVPAVGSSIPGAPADWLAVVTKNHFVFI